MSNTDGVKELDKKMMFDYCVETLKDFVTAVKKSKEGIKFESEIKKVELCLKQLEKIGNSGPYVESVDPQCNIILRAIAKPD